MKVVSFLFCLASYYSFTQEVKQVSIGTKSTGNGEISLELIARKQSYAQRTVNDNDTYESVINSPKSVVFTENGAKFYIHSLEGHETGVFDASTFQKIKVIRHQFDENNEDRLFLKNETSIFGYPYYGEE
ncbi:MAG: hypothetical protein EBS34_09760, partial [Flavobacteriales bacterium]|nr:hypothetical protein [Flavobacteriales bacterium]